MFGTILAIGNAQGKVSHEFLGWATMKFRSYTELDCGGSCKVAQAEAGQAPAGQSSIPALAGFQSEHAVEIPSMLTTENENSENHSKGVETAAYWRCLGLF